MLLINHQKIRIKEYKQGFSVEIQKTKWYGRKYWTHLICVNGIRDMPLYYNDYNSALEEACFLFKVDLIYDTNRFKSKAI